MRIVQTVPGTTVDTITLSVQQQRHVQQCIRNNIGPTDHDNPQGSDRIKVHLMDYRSLPEEWKNAFDRVVSVEMIEAVGKDFLEVSPCITTS